MPADDRTLETSTAPGTQKVWAPDLGLVMCWCPPGSFVMGSPEDEDGREDVETPHRVELTSGFWMGRTQVTQTQWWMVMGDDPSEFTGEGRPVEHVDWDRCVAFCRTLTAREREAGRLPAGLSYRLPTEAQWEYACRAGTAGSLAGGLDSVAWYGGNGGEETKPVGEKQPNAWGLHDMLGNVWEWCADRYGDYPSDAVRDPRGPSSGTRRVFRGGCWYAAARVCRPALRGKGVPGCRWEGLGLRLALCPADPP